MEDTDAGAEVSSEESRDSFHQLHTNLGHNVFVPALKYKMTQLVAVITRLSVSPSYYR